MGGSQSAQSWVNWHIYLNVLGDVAIVNYKWQDVNVREHNGSTLWICA